MIPLSTAKWDPQWYHQNKGPTHWFIDKRGVINGLRAEVFAPTQEDACREKPCEPSTCSFLREYYQQLKALDFDDIMRRIERICGVAKQTVGFDEEPVAVLIVHEAPSNPCSERGAIMRWFAENGVVIEEYVPNKAIK